MTFDKWVEAARDALDQNCREAAMIYIVEALEALPASPVGVATARVAMARANAPAPVSVGHWGMFG